MDVAAAAARSSFEAEGDAEEPVAWDACVCKLGRGPLQLLEPEVKVDSEFSVSFLLSL